MIDKNTFNEFIEFLKKDLIIDNDKYYYLGKRCISVSKLIGLYAKKKLKKKSIIDNSEAREEGIAIHKAFEKYFGGDKSKNSWGGYPFHVSAAESKLKIIDKKYHAVEVPILDKTTFIVGKIDMIGVLENGDWFVLDWKTSANPSFIDSVQLYLYKILLTKALWEFFQKIVNVHGYIVNVPRELFQYTSKLTSYSSATDNPIAEAIYELHAYNLFPEMENINFYWHTEEDL